MVVPITSEMNIGDVVFFFTTIEISDALCVALETTCVTSTCATKDMLWLVLPKN